MAVTPGFAWKFLLKTLPLGAAHVADRLAHGLVGLGLHEGNRLFMTPSPGTPLNMANSEHANSENAKY
jgi:hypothetical protein